MARNKVNMEVLDDEVRVKNEPICYTQSISQNKQENKVKEEPIDQQVEEKFSTTEEFTNKISIAFLNVETNTTESHKTNKLKKSKVSSDDKIRYRCNICNKNFISPSQLVIHQRIHTGERPFECEICKKSFNQSNSLVAHRRTHTGEKPFKCDVCKNRFAQSINLVNHRRIHTGEKPFECTICKKSFKTSSDLVRHRKIHTGERPFKCDICNKYFTTSSNLAAHHRKFHN